MTVISRQISIAFPVYDSQMKPGFKAPSATTLSCFSGFVHIGTSGTMAIDENTGTFRERGQVEPLQDE